MNKFRSGWYLIYTRPQHERKVNAKLSEMGIDSFLPLVNKLRVWHDRKKYAEHPLFPSYVFVYLNDLQKYYLSMEADGFLYYVRMGKDIVQVADTVVNNIKLVVAQDDSPEVSYSRFLPGKKVTIRKGALTGLFCEIVQAQNTSKLLVRVELLKRNLLLTLPEESLMAL